MAVAVTIITTPFMGIPSFPHSPFAHCASGRIAQINSHTQIHLSGSGFGGIQTKADLLLDKYPREILACLVPRDSSNTVYSSMVCDKKNLVTIQCPLMEEWINKLWYSHLMKYHI